jgi:hypothetical protein
VTDISSSKDTGHAGFHPVGIALQLPSFWFLSVAQQIGSGKDESALVPLDYAREPIGIGLCADKN